MNKQPLVSVLMTSYNRELFIAEAIESVLASGYTNFELIVVDDASTDNTVEIAKGYEKQDQRVTVFVNDINLGQFPNRNKAAGYAKGKYIKYLDSDDRIYDWGLAYCVEMMEKYPKAGMAMFKSSNKVEEEYLSSEAAVNFHFFRKPFLMVGPSGIILRREAFERIGYFNPGYGVPSDMFFNIKMASFFPVAMMEKEFFFYREHEGQEIKNRFSYLCFTYPYLRDLLQLPQLPIREEKKNEILTKAKRDFLKSCLRDIMDTHKIKPAYRAFKQSKMNFKDVLSGILNKPL